jgi:hypothetical protein
MPGPVEGTIVLQTRRPGIGGWARKHPVGLALGGAAILVAVTVGYRIWLARWENLPHVAETNWSEGQEALDAGEFDAAKQKLAIAASAFERLGIRDERSSQSRQLADEAAILADRCGATLQELIGEAARFSPPEGWPERFHNIYEGQSVVFDAEITATPDGSSTGAYEIDVQILDGRGPEPSRVGIVDLTGFKLFEAMKPKVGQAVLFGARLESLTFDKKAWRLRVQPQSGVIMTQTKALEQAGWDPALSASAKEKEDNKGPDNAAQFGPVPRKPGLAWLAPTLIGFLPPQGESAPLVEVPELSKRPDLLNKRVAVDGRVRLFQTHPGLGFDEILLKETNVIFRLPPRLRPSEPPRQYVVRMEGVLRKADGWLVVDVDNLKFLDDDPVRLDRGLAALSPDDVKLRLRWADWASRRADLYTDQDLKERALTLAAEAYRIEADQRGAKSPEGALDLARRVRERGLPEAMSSALAHRAYVAKAKEAATPEVLDRLAAEVLAALPESGTPHAADLANWQAAYEEDPYAAYRQAPEAVRRAFDRRLLADILERSIRLKAEADPKSGLKLAQEAAQKLPDRLAVAQELQKKGLADSVKDVGKLRRSEVLEFAKTFDKMSQPEQGRKLIQDWLLDQRETWVGREDVPGRLRLSADYLELLGDKATALDLLREAHALDPSSKDVSEAFRRLGYRREGDDWVPAVPGAAATAEAADPGDDQPRRDDPLLDLTPAEVTARLGKPDRKSQSMTQDRVTMQWTYLGARGSTQVILFVKQPGYPPRVIGRYTPR